MTPAAHWSPDDYYRAKNAAHRAWVDAEYRAWIDGVLGEADGPGTTSLVGSSVSPNPPQPPRSPHAATPPHGTGEGGFDTHNQGGNDG